MAKKVDMMQLKLKKAQEVAWSPGKNFMMTAFMLWMSGQGVHIFSIMITFYAVYNPLKSAFTVSQGAHSRSCRAHAWCFMPDGEMAAGTRARIDHLTAICAPARVRRSCTS